MNSLLPHSTLPEAAHVVRVGTSSGLGRTTALLTVLLALASISVQSFAAPPYAHTLTGDRFVRMMNGTEPPTGDDYILREKAYSYLDGVRDGAEGRDWCDVNQLKTPDLAYELAADIAMLPAAERKKNASILLIEQLRRRFPCPAKGGKP